MGGVSSCETDSTHTGRDPQGRPGTFRETQGLSGMARDFSGRLRDLQGGQGPHQGDSGTMDAQGVRDLQGHLGIRDDLSNYLKCGK